MQLNSSSVHTYTKYTSKIGLVGIFPNPKVLNAVHVSGKHMLPKLANPSAFSEYQVIRFMASVE